MGVPALFRWLSNKYPKIISSVIEERPEEINGVKVPVDTTKPNPNGFEYDNLYLDMNGIVHPCSHPEDRPPPANEEEMMLAIYEFTDRLVTMVRPRKLLMIAIDGVAPRAKMNQQRSRRFRSAQDAKQEAENKLELLKMLKSKKGAEDEPNDEDQAPKKAWDSNAITPGTPFMFKLSACLNYWCSYKVNTDPGWANLKVIISDATVPGEGEHKIMEFVRSQRTSQEHDPNTRHVICGLDADLIMLGLATHEPHFHVLREDVFFQEAKARTCHLCGQKGHKAAECQGEANPKQGEFGEKDPGGQQKPFIWLHVSALREYLAEELFVIGQPFAFDLERALDDWVFMCFFVGNDFLPHLPSLDIRENGIDTLIAIWRDNIPVMGGYVTKDGQVDLSRAQYILEGLAKQEAAIFKRRRDAEVRKEEREKSKRRRNEGGRSTRFRRQSPDYGAPKRSGGDAPTQNLALFAPGKGELPKDAKQITHEMAMNRGAISRANAANKSAAAVLKAKLMGDAGELENKESTEGTSANPTDSQDKSGPEEKSPSVLGKRKADVMEDDPSTPGRKTPEPGAQEVDPDEPPPDTVKLWEDGYEERYYEQKFHVEPGDVSFRNKVALAYVEGLAWVLLYYFQGCPSWTWYYPYHYAPFAADFVDIDKTPIKFDKGKPFRPYEQLMGVMPAASRHVIPEPFHNLMTDEDSEIIDFYPEDFQIDMNGKKMAWQGIALLPFIDPKRLLDAMAKHYHLLSKDEVDRNEVGQDVLIFSDRNALYDAVTTHFYSKRQGDPVYHIDSRLSRGLVGTLEKNPEYLPQGPLIAPLETDAMPGLEEDRSISLFYQMPRSSHVHKSMLLRGVKFDPACLTRDDVDGIRRKSTRTGRSFGGVPLRNGDSNGYGRSGGGGRMNYAADRPNPFAEHIAPGFVPPPHFGDRHQGGGGGGNGGDWRGPPPSHGRPPPPHSYPPHQQQQEQQQYYGRSGPPPPPPQHNYGPPGSYNQSNHGWQQQRPPPPYGGGYGHHHPPPYPPPPAQHHPQGGGYGYDHDGYGRPPPPHMNDRPSYSQQYRPPPPPPPYGYRH